MEETKAQVDQALGRLEAAVEAIGKRAAEREAQLGRKLEALRQESAAAKAGADAAKAEVTAAKAEANAARAENETLKALLAQTSGRLDQAIERLQDLLAKAVAE
jgi:chromosome segregation ATPase